MSGRYSGKIYGMALKMKLQLIEGIPVTILGCSDPDQYLQILSYIGITAKAKAMKNGNGFIFETETLDDPPTPDVP